MYGPQLTPNFHVILVTVLNFSITIEQSTTSSTKLTTSTTTTTTTVNNVM